jgi:ABC-2 type transport system ATP-binding protein
MRQRLGVAQALLHQPKLLILDEPMNGLDPEGIYELRMILKRLAHENGICVVVSSHIMSEMEQLCDRVGIISGGRMIGTYTVEELIDQGKDTFCVYEFKVSDAGKAAQLCGLDEKH